MVPKIFTQLETIAKKIQLKYMAKKRTIEVVKDGRVLFHPGNIYQQIMLEYQKRLKKLGLK